MNCKSIFNHGPEALFANSAGSGYPLLLPIDAEVLLCVLWNTAAMSTPAQHHMHWGENIRTPWQTHGYKADFKPLAILPVISKAFFWTERIISTQATYKLQFFLQTAATYERRSDNKCSTGSSPGYSDLLLSFISHQNCCSLLSPFSCPRAKAKWKPIGFLVTGTTVSKMTAWCVTGIQQSPRKRRWKVARALSNK